MKVQKKWAVLIGASLLWIYGAPLRAYEQVLPAFESCNATIQAGFSGGLGNLQCLVGTGGATYVGSIHDDFMSFSIEALEIIQDEAPLLLPVASYGEYSNSFGAGSGTIEVGVLIKANGPGVLNNPDPFPNAVSSNTSASEYERTWGGDTGIDTNDPGNDPNDPVLTVDDVLTWLAPDTTPVFVFDLADPGNTVAGDLFISGQLVVTGPNGTVAADGTITGTGDPLKVWAFDNAFTLTPTDLTAQAGIYNEDAPVKAFKKIPVYVAGSGCTDGIGAPYDLGADWCEIDNNRGSGFSEFIVYVPGMGLDAYADAGAGNTALDNLFWGNFTISSSQAADEELYLTRRVGIPENCVGTDCPISVPEPNVLALLALGCFAMGFVSRRRIV